MTPERRHADGVVVLGGPDLRVRLPLAVLPPQLAIFRRQRAQGDGAGAPKKTQKRKGKAVSQNDGAAQGRPVEPARSSANDTALKEETDREVHRKPRRDDQS